MKIKRYRQVDEFLTFLVSKAQKKLHLLPSPLLFVEIDTMDNNGNIIEKIKFKSNSFVRNAYNVTAFQSGAAADYTVGWGNGYTSLKSLAGTVRNLGAAGAIQSGIVSRATTSSSAILSFSTGGGVVVGSGDTAESLNDYILVSEIANGIGAGQLQWGGHGQGGPFWDGTYMYSTYSRAFSNGSGGDVTMREIGLKNTIVWNGQQIDNFLWARDVLPSPITIGNGQVKTITYTIKLPF
jgi:hypothetical protein